MRLIAPDCALHQVAAELANLPVGWTTTDATMAGCHRKDTSCSRRPLSTQDEKDAKRRWWLPRATHSVWLASHQLASHQLRQVGSTGGGVGGAAAGCAAAAPAGQPRHDTQLVLWTELTPPTAAAIAAAGSQSGGGGAGGGASTLPFLPFPTVPTAPPSLPPIPTPTLAALPREAVGRLCGARMQVDPSWLRRAPPMDCAVLGGGVGSFFGQAVLHMQFTHADTRRAILEALHWWKAPPAAASAAAATTAASTASSSASPSASSAAAPLPSTAPWLRPTSCAALASGSAVVSGTGMLAGVVLSSALAPSALICLLPGNQPNQPVALPLPSPSEPSHCPCCWRVDALQQAAARGADGGGAALASSPQAAAAESKALRKAARYSGCRIWRRYA